MTKVLVVAEQALGELKPATLNAIAAGLKIADSVDLLLAGHALAAAAGDAATATGVAKVLVVDDAKAEHQLPEVLAPAIAEVAGQGYTHVLAAATVQGKTLMPRVAALLDSQQISDITAVVDAETFERPIYAGNAIATVQSSDAIKVVTVRTTAFDPVALGADSAPQESIVTLADPGLSRYVGESLSSSDRPELTSADVIVSGGRGVGSADNFALINALADKLGAAVGASRAAVDAGYVPNDYQVGQTGKVVAPNLYVAVGISGAIQHLAGMKDSKTIVAINKDEEAPIFQVADYGLVGDLFQLVPEMTEKMTQG